MNPSDEWRQPGDPEPREPEARNPGYGMPPPYGYGPNGIPEQPVRKKSKWIAALLSLLVPGTGHMYLGLMAKGIAIMLLLALNICAIVYFAVEHGGSGGNVLIIVLFSLLMPILYFYNLFDALQQTEAMNERRAAGWPGTTGWNGAPPAPGSHSQPHQQTPVAGVVLLAAGGVALFSMANNSWTRWLLHSSGSMIGAVILIVIGGLIWLWERRGGSGRRD